MGLIVWGLKKRGASSKKGSLTLTSSAQLVVVLCDVSGRLLKETCKEWLSFRLVFLIATTDTTTRLWKWCLAFLLFYGSSHSFNKLQKNLTTFWKKSFHRRRHRSRVKAWLHSWEPDRCCPFSKYI